MIENRKQCIVYGNCHMGGVIDILNHTPQFTEQYEIYPIKFIQDINITELLADPVLLKCDLFIHQSVQLQNSYGPSYSSDYVIKKLKPQCRVIAIPNLYGMPTCFFPQYMKGNTYNCKLGLETISFYRDTIIENGLYNGKKISDIVKQYQNIDIYNEEELEIEWKNFIKKVQLREQEWDVKISDYIKDNARKDRLFFDPGHPTPVLLKHITYELLSLLEIHVDEKAVLETDIEPLVAFEMPICGAVQAFFGINSGYMLHRVLKMIPGGVSLYKYILQYSSLAWKDSRLPILIKIKCFILFCLFFTIGNCYNIVKLLHRKILKKICLYKERSYRC